MAHLDKTATDDEMIRFVDQWATLMEEEDYEAAFAFTDHIPSMRWSPSLIRKVIKSYDRCDPAQKVTLRGESTDITQRKDVTRWPRNKYGEIAEVWYDLNIDGFASDLTATFRIVETAVGLEGRLNDIHVM